MPICPHCNMPLSIREGAAENCAACGEPLPPPPKRETVSGGDSIKGVRFALQAGHYSVFAPLVMFCLSSLFLKLLLRQPGAMMAIYSLAIVVGIVLSGLVLGGLGVWFGVRYRSARAVIWSVIGIVLNGAILVAWVHGAIASDRAE
jgi:hypothetical protein